MGKSTKGKKARKVKKARKGKKARKAKKARKGKKQRKAKKKSRKAKKKSRKAKKKSRKAKKKGRKGKKGKKGRKQSRNGKSQGRSSSCMNETCINTAMSYMKIMKDRVSNFLRQKTRIGKFQTTAGNKAGKKGLFGPILNRIREAGGGNSSNLKCNGNSSLPGAAQLKNLTTLLAACEGNINTSCVASLPTINKTEHDLCETAMNAFAALTKDCHKKTGAEACSCWTNSTLEFTVKAVKKCDVSAENKLMTAAKKKCTEAFGKCRKIEDEVSPALSACSPANTKSRATADIKQGLKNKAAVKKASKKINETAAAGNATSRQGGIPCAGFITDVKGATQEILRAPLLEGLETKLKALASATVITCSSTEVTMLYTLSVEMDKTAAAIDLNIESKQTDLIISQGEPASITALQAEIDAEATTAAPAPTMTTMSSSRRRMFKVKTW